MSFSITKGPVSAEYLKINKLGKVPTFVGADGYTLHEAIAIAIYSESEKSVNLSLNLGISNLHNYLL